MAESGWQAGKERGEAIELTPPPPPYHPVHPSCESSLLPPHIQVSLPVREMSKQPTHSPPFVLLLLQLEKSENEETGRGREAVRRRPFRNNFEEEEEGGGRTSHFLGGGDRRGRPLPPSPSGDSFLGGGKRGFFVSSFSLRRVSASSFKRKRFLLLRKHEEYPPSPFNCAVSNVYSHCHNKTSTNFTFPRLELEDISPLPLSLPAWSEFLSLRPFSQPLLHEREIEREGEKKRSRHPPPSFIPHSLFLSNEKPMKEGTKERKT